MSRVEREIEVRALRKQVADLKEAAVARHRLEAALRSSEELVRATLDDCPVPLCRLDENGKLLLANEALAHLLGYFSRHDLQELVSVLGLFMNAGEFLRLREAAFVGSDDLDMVAVLRRKDGGNCGAALRIRRSEAPPAYTLAIICCGGSSPFRFPRPPTPLPPPPSDPAGS